MLFGRYSFLAEFRNQAILPPYKGSTLRGAFGLALKDISCVLKSNDCQGCPLVKTCVYRRVFEIDSQTSDKKSGAQPHAFVIEPPESAQRNFAHGEHLNFKLLLFGFANDLLPYFIYAFEEVGKTGLGKFLGGRRASFKLIQVTSEYGPVFDSQDRTVKTGLAKELEFQNPSYTSDSEFKLTLHLETPLRLKFKNMFSDELPFHILVRAMLRRISSLNNFFGQGEPPLDYSGLIKRAETVTIVNSSLEWLDWSRFSNRQQTRMQLGGITGAITYTGKLQEYINLLKYCEIVHLGKNTTFGLGKIKMDTMA